MKKRYILPLLLLAVLYVGIGWYFATMVIASPTRSARPITDYLEEDIPDLTIAAIEQAQIEGADATIATTFFDNELAGECAVVFLHGYTGHRYSQLEYVPMFWERGCDVAMYDARGHNESDEAFHTFGFYEKQDAVAVVDWVIERTGLDASQIGLMGSSYGAATSLQTLDLRDDLAFIIADSAYQDMETIVTHQGQAQFGAIVNPFVPVAIAIAEARADIEFDAVSPQNAVVDKTTPILLLHIREDGFTPATHSEAIYQASNQVMTEFHLTDWAERHGTPFHGNPDEYTALIAQFLENKVPDFGLATP